MCGIAGIVSSGQPVADVAIASMQRELRHRGPDDRGLFIDDKGMAALAHTRLSIQDPSPAGHQPMSTAGGRYTIVFNGEVYNFHELRKDLEQSGSALTSGTDTEVILRLFERDGPRFVATLRGMYAFAIWDALDCSLFLARDAFGIKPLYFRENAGTFYFASEVRSLIAAALMKPSIDVAGLVRFLETGSVAEDVPLVEGVRSLPAGHTMHWHRGCSDLRCFWSPSFPNADISDPRQAVVAAREALLGSVRAHFVSDVPVGIFLSGGIDSTALVALARATDVQAELSTYSISVDDAAIDEGTMAAAVAAHFQTKHCVLRVTAADASRLLPEFLDAIDMPTVDGFNTWLVSSLAHQSGTKTTLSGLGGDELFAGYPSFTRVPKMVRLAAAASWTQPLPRLGGQGLARFGTSSRLRRLGEFLQGEPTTTNAYRAYRGVFSHGDALRLAAHLTGTDEAALQHDVDYQGGTDTLDPRDAVSLLELTNYLRNQLLRDSDVMSMAHGLELRVPFVDAQLFDVLARIAPDIRYGARKKLLIDAVPEIPAFVRHHPKRGFTLPFGKWFQGALGESLYVNSELPVPAREWYQRWSLFIFAQWRRRVLGESSP